MPTVGSQFVHGSPHVLSVEDRLDSYYLVGVGVGIRHLDIFLLAWYEVEMTDADADATGAEPA